MTTETLPSQPAVTIAGQTESIDQAADREVLSADQLRMFIDNVGNHEAKLLAAGVVALEPDTVFSEAMLASTMSAHQGDNKGWVQHGSIPGKYCHTGFTAAGLVQEQSVQGRKGPMIAWQATELGVAELPVVGALTDWSLANPDISLQQVYGSSMSRTDLKSPEVRHSIYEVLLTSPGDNPPSVQEIAASIGDERISAKVVRSQVLDMKALGILDVTSKFDDDYNPRFIITNPTLTHPGLEQHELSDESQIMYATLQAMYSGQQEQHSLADLLAVAQRLDPQADLRQVRRLFNHGVSEASSNLPGIQLAEGQMPPQRHTAVSLSETYKQPVEDIFNRLDELQTEPGCEKYAAKADEIISNPVLFSRLMAKAKNFSPEYVGQQEGSEGLERRIGSVISALGNATVKDIRRQLESDGRRVGTDTVRSVLSRLATRGVIDAEVVQPDPSKDAQVTMYRAAVQSDQPRIDTPTQ